MKPGNILVEESTDHVYLTDFGVAKQTTARGLTSTGHFLGTVEYAAPEQIEGGVVDARTDVYALGCVLYECLTGAPPFSHGTEHAVLHAHLVDPPPSVSRARPDLPHTFDGVVATAMAKDPDDRYGSCGELAHAARHAATGAGRRVDGPITPPRAETIQSAPVPVVPESPEPMAAVPVPPVPPEPPAPPAVSAEEPEPARQEKGGLTGAKQWLLVGLLVVLAAAASGLVVYFLTKSDAPAASTASTPQPGAVHPLADLVPSPVWDTCKTQKTPRPGAVETAVCVPPADATSFTPDHLEISTYASGAAVQHAYEAERKLAGVPRNRGRCDGLSWSGEGTWLHNPGTSGAAPKPGGSRFCHFEGNDVVIVWTHRKLGQDTHTDILAVAREGGSDHPGPVRVVAVLAPPDRQGRLVVRVSAPSAVVALLDGTGGSQHVEIVGHVTVGRGDDADLLIDDPEISRAHAVLLASGDGLEIEDLGSMNGTWVNGDRITGSTALSPTDVIKIGTTRIEVISVAAGAHAAGSQSAQQSSPTPVLAEDELRPVSALFADIVGSTAIAERLDPEDFTVLIRGCVDRMCQAVEQFGGAIDAYMGDGIAAFFGFPSANEDDADCAARAALGIVAAIDSYAEEARRTWNLPDLSVRVGVNSGQVAVGVVGSAERHPVALGDTMNVAARLQAAAEPRTVAIGGATAKKLRGRFLVSSLGHISVKGRETPVEAWRLLRARPDRPRHDQSALVGREHETAALKRVADQLRAGRGGLVVLEGEPGIGKTRLLEWFRDEIQGDALWLEGQCASYGGQPSYHAVAEALKGWLAIDDLAGLSLGPDAAPYLTTLVSSSAGGEADLELSDGAAAEFGSGLRRAYADWLRGLCRRQPVVLALHDLQWADHRTLELVESLLDLLGDVPLTIAATSRLAQDSSDRRLLERARTAHAERLVELRLGPLSEAEAEQLLTQLAPGELADDARREVISRAEGNALYVEQLLRSLLETGGLVARRTWALTVPAAQLPTGLESLLVARIAALPRDARRVAQVAAVFGRTFSANVLARASRIDDFEANLARLVRADIVRETHPAPDRELAFTHGLLQEAALSTLTRARRRELYRAVATATEQVFADSLDDELERLAFYHARAGDLSQALAYLERAAERASSLGACTQSVDLLKRAANVAEKLDNVEAQERIAGQLSPAGG